MPLTSTFHIDLPKTALDWIIWACILTGLFILGFMIRKPEQQLTRIQLVWLAALSVLLLFTSSIPRLNVDFGSIFGAKQAFEGLIPPTLLLFVCVPWMVTAGVVGIIPAIALALASGFFVAVTHTHTIFTPLIYTALVVAFSLLNRQRKLGDKLLPNLPPILTAFAALFLISPLLLLDIPIFAQNSMTEKFWLFLPTWLVLAVTVIIAGIICQALAFLSPDQWKPASFLKTRSLSDPINLATQQTERLTNGNFEESLQGRPGWGKIRQLQRALETLRINLKAQDEVQSHLSILEQSQLGDRAIDEVLLSILRAALGREASAARLMLTKQHSTHTQIEAKLRLGQGQQSTVYAYLDALILDRVKETGKLVLTDLKVDQVFDLSPGMPYPVSIVALPLIHVGLKYGLLWVGFDTKHWFTPEELTFYESLAKRASLVIHNSERVTEAQSARMQLEKALNALPDGLLFFDHKDLLTFANQSAGRILDVDIQSQMGRPMLELIQNNELLGLIQGAAEKPITKDLAISENHAYEVTTLKFEDSPEKGGILVNFRNLERVRNLNAQKTEFVTAVSHDLRKPLSLMKGYVTMLHNIGNLSDQQQMYIQRIYGGIDGMMRLVNNILNLERMEAGEALQLTNVSINELIQQTVQSLDLQAKQRKVNVATHYDHKEGLTLLADRILLQQALFNLLDNAIKYSPMGSKVDITVSKQNDRMRFSIKDQGVGIAPLDQPRLFDRYFHHDAGLEPTQGGNGLGLAIVRSIVDKHGGKVGVTSQLGKGSTFYFDIPIL